MRQFRKVQLDAEVAHALKVRAVQGKHKSMSACLAAMLKHQEAE